MSEKNAPLNKIDPPDNTDDSELELTPPASPAPNAKPIDPPDNTRAGS